MFTRKVAFGLCLLALCLPVMSCKKLESASTPTGPLSLQTTKIYDAIPEEYGTLIGVTQNGQSPKWVGLWFQKPDKTIVGVFVNVEQGVFYNKTVSIPRK
jgi:hypothetical protein